jgi:hypothetical protein
MLETMIHNHIAQLAILLFYILVKCYVWIIALYNSETWTLRKLERKYLESFEICCWRRLEKIKWANKVTNEVLDHLEEKRALLNNIPIRKANWIGHMLRRNCLLVDAIEG